MQIHHEYKHPWVYTDKQTERIIDMFIHSSDIYNFIHSYSFVLDQKHFVVKLLDMYIYSYTLIAAVNIYP